MRICLLSSRCLHNVLDFLLGIIFHYMHFYAKFQSERFSDSPRIFHLRTNACMTSTASFFFFGLLCLSFSVSVVTEKLDDNLGEQRNSRQVNNNNISFKLKTFLFKIVIRKSYFQNIMFYCILCIH